MTTIQKIISENEEEFDKKFGKCDLSLCDEHEKMMCERCKFKDYISLSQHRLLESVREEVEKMVEEGEEIRNGDVQLGYDMAIKKFLELLKQK